jgi:hypothetical protein
MKEIVVDAKLDAEVVEIASGLVVLTTDENLRQTLHVYDRDLNKTYSAASPVKSTVMLLNTSVIVDDTEFILVAEEFEYVSDSIANKPYTIYSIKVGNGVLEDVAVAGEFPYPISGTRFITQGPKLLLLGGTRQDKKEIIPSMLTEVDKNGKFITPFIETDRLPERLSATIPLVMDEIVHLVGGFSVNSEGKIAINSIVYSVHKEDLFKSPKKKTSPFYNISKLETSVFLRKGTVVGNKAYFISLNVTGGIFEAPVHKPIVTVTESFKLKDKVILDIASIEKELVCITTKT